MSDNDFLKQRHRLLFKDLPAADGTNVGVRVVGYCHETDDYLIVYINWRNKELIDDSEPDYIDAYKLSYRYCPDEAINIGEKP